ncbi:cysteine-rich repeat secretory protein 55-like [Phalaenopsis equestris]|uniref:cysteine-rich repeat secretory protein 55-like n=1 Tax=Phalaenopsis equestris TaxID=78828 RepID=UPI0009E417DF|nr:cysteine-rich repeat secretory protein 55-like [Phalaenopsis equestris]
MQLLFLFLFLVSFPIATLGAVSLPIQQCGKNFTENNILQTSINNLLLDMVAKSSLNGYAISSYASDSCQTIYGLTQCQGDLSREACSTCITNAAQNIRSACPNAAISRAWQENCFLHYDTENFIGKLDKYFANVWYSFDASVNFKIFERAAGELMGEVMEETVRGREKFGFGESYVNENLTVYGMAQCTRDLGEHACNECMKNALEIISFYCVGKTGCRVFGSSCVVRYETYKFLQVDSPVVRFGEEEGVWFPEEESVHSSVWRKNARGSVRDVEHAEQEFAHAKDFCDILEEGFGSAAEKNTATPDFWK